VSLELTPTAVRGLTLARVRELSPFRVAALIALLYAVAAANAVAHHHVGSFAFVGRSFAERPGTSATIVEHAAPTSEAGYDGQFALFIALDPADAASSIDKPAYRYSHILYPIAARTVALGNDDWVPAAMVIVNVLAVFFGTLALGLILRRERQPVWWSASFGLFPGALVAFDRDLGDLLAYALVAVGVLALRWGTPRRVLLAGAVFALAALARESTLFFPAVLSLIHVAAAGPNRRRRLGEAAGLALVAAAPYGGWRMFILVWLGADHSVPSGLAPFPLAGLIHQTWDTSAVVNLLTVVAPGLILLWIALRACVRHRWAPLAICLALQLVVFVVFLPWQSYADYYAAGRLQLGGVVAALCCAPLLRAHVSRRVAVLGSCLAFAPCLYFVPIVLSGSPI
jgi:hypothetical protein